jgi:ribonuclease HI
MANKEMYFKGRRVFVEVNDSGEFVLDDGRARMRYGADDERLYNPWPSNLSDKPQKTVVKAPPSKKNTARVDSVDPDSIVAYTDGACLGNPGPAGLGYVVMYPDGKQFRRGEPIGHGTNNVAELTAIFRVLELVDERRRPLVIYTDSSYSIGVLTQGWKAKANTELISKIRNVMTSFARLELRKVKGHAGIPENELVDELARTAAETQQIVD